MIAIGCDHGGFALKQEVMRHLDELGLAYKDFGTYSEETENLLPKKKKSRYPLFV